MTEAAEAAGKRWLVAIVSGHYRLHSCLFMAATLQRDKRLSLGNPIDGIERGLRAGFNLGHVGIGESEMVTDLVDEHVADNAIHRLALLVRVTEDGDTVEKDPVGQTYGIPYAF